uniref:Uncharacterized protein n=1 Tax=Panagrellus redivivus TaxID=6233 RepID=A0A7E4W100_PANRE
MTPLMTTSNRWARLMPSWRWEWPSLPSEGTVFLFLNGRLAVSLHALGYMSSFEFESNNAFSLLPPF